MNGLMMQQPLLISTLLTHAERHHGDQEIVSRRVEGDIHRYTYRELGQRARQVANVLKALEIGTGDRVATLAWNGYRHMELYYAVSGSGAVLHTLNPRLHPDQVVWIADHAEDQILFFDLTFLRRYETFALVRLAREWDRLAGAGYVIHVAAREARVVADLKRLVGSVGWNLHPSTTHALRALLSAPID